MNETLDVGTLLNESGTHEINVARLQVHYDIEDDNNKEICFVRSLTLSSVEISHEFIHVSVDQNQLQHWA